MCGGFCYLQWKQRSDKQRVRQAQYFKHIPARRGTNRSRAYEFLIANQHAAADLTIAWMNNELERVGDQIMANKGKTKSTSSAPQKADWKGFANISLDTHDKEAIRANPYGESELWEGLTSLLATGHKIAVTLSPTDGNVSVAITGAFSNSPNKGLTMNSTANDVLTALNVALYKHFDKASGDWSSIDNETDDMS